MAQSQNRPDLCGTWREGRNCSLSKGHEGECFGDGLPIATLRDQFAIAAINGMTPARENTISERAQQAYRIADAMLEARKPK